MKSTLDLKRQEKQTQSLEEKNHEPNREEEGSGPDGFIFFYFMWNFSMITYPPT